MTGEIEEWGRELVALGFTEKEAEAWLAIRHSETREDAVERTNMSRGEFKANLQMAFDKFGRAMRIHKLMYASPETLRDPNEEEQEALKEALQDVWVLKQSNKN